MDRASDEAPNQNRPPSRSGSGGLSGCAAARLARLIVATLFAWAPSPELKAQDETEPVRCPSCHPAQASDYNSSAHAEANVHCETCHGGRREYAPPPDPLSHYRITSWTAGGPQTASGTSPTPFDHGPEFKGRPTRQEVPPLCGGCHADIARMNPYGLPTDQLAQYLLSDHGKALYDKSNLNAAVCIDCHGTHRILPPGDPESTVYVKNVPATCGACHADPQVMQGTGLRTSIVQEYRESVHGQGLLEKNDTAMPNCATCHGSHSAVPPGYQQVGQVCGKCHQQEKQDYEASPHAGVPNFPWCISCHFPSLATQNHQIRRVVPSPDAIRTAYEQALASVPQANIQNQKLIEAYEKARKPSVDPFQLFCQRCHSPPQTHPGDASQGTAARPIELGQALYHQVRHGELLYASTAHRVQQVGQGILIVDNEEQQVKEMKTRLVALGPLQHTLNLDKVKHEVSQEAGIGRKIDQSLDHKLESLNWRYYVLVPVCGFLLLFSLLLYVKAKQLETRWISPPNPPEGGDDGG